MGAEHFREIVGYGVRVVRPRKICDRCTHDERGENHVLDAFNLRSQGNDSPCSRSRHKSSVKTIVGSFKTLRQLATRTLEPIRGMDQFARQCVSPKTPNVQLVP
jgi:hypothetical protein